MRRLMVCVFVLFVATTAWGGYPEEYYGPQIGELGCIDVEAYIPAGGFLDRYPWSMPSPEENMFWWGTLCVKGWVVVLEFTSIGPRVCTESPWGGRDVPETCYGWRSLELSVPDRHVMVWDPDFEPDNGFYLASVWNGEVWLYDSLTNLGDGTYRFVQGAFEFVPPLWFEESDDYSRWKLNVSPATTPVLNVVTRSGAQRAGDEPDKQ